MNFLNTLKVLRYHPLCKSHIIDVYLKYFTYRIRGTFLKDSFIYSSPYYKNGLKILIKDIEQYQIIYTQGFPEFYEMAFLLHFLRQTDIFVDIGANKGLFSVLASGHAGAKVYAFEPIPATFTDLRENIHLNDLEKKVTLINAGLGSQNSKALFSTNRGPANSIISDTHREYDSNIVKVQIYTLDEILPDLTSPTVLKIDVEGFETEVLRGANNTLNNLNVKGLIIELNGAAKKYNYDEEKIHIYLLENGFKPFRYYPFTRKLEPQDNHISFIDKKYMSDNTIYIRDYEFVADRIKSADKIQDLTTAF